jgi:hypothetical protein
MPHRYLTFPGLLFVFPDHPPRLWSFVRFSRSPSRLSIPTGDGFSLGSSCRCRRFFTLTLGGGVSCRAVLGWVPGLFSIRCRAVFDGIQVGCRNTFDGMSRMRSVGCRDGFLGSRGRGMVDWGERRRRCGVGGKRVSTKRKGSASRCQRRRRNNLANSSGRTGQCNLFPTQVVLRFHFMKPTHGRCAVTMSRSRRIGAVWGPEAESSDPTRSASVCSSLRLAVLEHRLCRRPA